MVVLENLQDQWEVKRLLTKDNLYQGCYKTDDLYSENVFTGNQAWFVVKENNKEIGILLLKQFSNLVCVPHGGLFKEFRGKETVRIIKEILDFIHRSNFKTIITIPSKHKHVIKLMKKIKYEYKATIKDGCVNDDLMLFGEK